MGWTIPDDAGRNFEETMGVGVANCQLPQIGEREMA
jgi:hypothetical protein